LSHPFWPHGEQSQIDYEALREAVLAGKVLENLAAARFERRGLAGLITWPRTGVIYTATVLGAERPPWTPYVDPRFDVLAAAYEMILASGNIVEVKRSAG
jgi:hypothetical protein